MTFLDQARLALQTALLGEISRELRVVTVAVDNGHIRIRVYHEGEASEQLLEDLDAVVTEVYALVPDLSPGRVTVELELVRVDAPGPILVHGLPVFARKGTGAYGPEHAHLHTSR